MEINLREGPELSISRQNNVLECLFGEVQLRQRVLICTLKHRHAGVGRTSNGSSANVKHDRGIKLLKLQGFTGTNALMAKMGVHPQ